MSFFKTVHKNPLTMSSICSDIFLKVQKTSSVKLYFFCVLVFLLLASTNLETMSEMKIGLMILTVRTWLLLIQMLAFKNPLQL